MTGREALQQKKEINSTKQKMIRQKQVSLPYHRPKQRTLKEFLQNRPKFSEALPSSLIGIRPSTAIKMMNKQLQVVS